MIRAIQIYDFNDNLVYDNNFARYTLNLPVIMRITLEEKERLVSNIDHTPIGLYKLSILMEPEYTIGVLSDRSNKDDEIDSFLIALNREIKNILGNGDISKFEDEYVDRFDERLEDLIKQVPVKITFSGSGGVGKTTMVTLLAKQDIIKDYNPTLMADVEHLDFNLGIFSITLFTVAGQRDYRRTWDVVTEATDIVVLVLDSTEANLRETKEEILPVMRRYAPFARYVAIANKQDIEGALPPAEIEEEIGLPTFGMVATRPDAYQKILGILQDIITTVP